MAKKVSEAKVNRAKTASGKKLLPEAEIIAISLVNTKLTYNVGADGDGEFSFGVHVGKTIAVEAGAAFVYRCTIEISKTAPDSDENTAGFSATYMCAFYYDGASDTADLIARRFSVTTLWGMFTSLFAIVGQQIGVDFPPMPAHPKNVSFMDE